MTKFLCLMTLAALMVMPATTCQAQKLKIPNLLPFKKQTKDVTPYQLSDGRSGSMGQSNRSPFGRIPTPQLDQKSPSFAEKFKLPKFDLFKKQEKQAPTFGQSGSQTPNAMDNFNSKSKQFFGKIDRGFKKFGEDTKRAFSDGWNPPQSKQAWWNQAPTESRMPLMNEWMQLQAERWPGNQPSVQPQVVPRPRVANEYQNGQPRRRF